MIHYAQLVLKYLCPIVKDILKWNTIDDPKGHVDVRPVIPAAKGRGAGERACCDSWVVPRHLYDALAHLVAIPGGKHAGLLSSHCEESYYTILSSFKKPLGCHSERSEESARRCLRILRCAQNDSRDDSF